MTTINEVLALDLPASARRLIEHGRFDHPHVQRVLAGFGIEWSAVERPPRPAPEPTEVQKLAAILVSNGTIPQADAQAAVGVTEAVVDKVVTEVAEKVEAAVEAAKVEAAQADVAVEAVSEWPAPAA
jgi:uncharacterized protein YPO0396